MTTPTMGFDEKAEKAAQKANQDLIKQLQKELEELRKKGGK